MQWTPLKILFLPVIALVTVLGASSQTSPALTGKASSLRPPPYYRKHIAPIVRTEVRLAPVSIPKAVATSSKGSCTPEYIAQHESGGNYSAQNRSSTASGKYQYLDSTWNGYGGYNHAKDAPPSVQEERFAKDYARTGGSMWAVC